MRASRHEIPLQGLRQAEIDWLLRCGVTVAAMVRPTAILAATGGIGPDGIFESSCDGSRWLAFEQEDDIVFWQPRSSTFATDSGRSFALGEELINNPGTYAFDCSLNIFADPLDWLRAGRDGIVILDWSRAFERLRDAQRVAVVEELFARYTRSMKPGRLPEVSVLRSMRRRAA